MPICEPTSPSPEDEIIHQEVFGELVNRASSVLGFFFQKQELDIYMDHLAGTPVRAMAMTHHMSRYNIRKKVSTTKKKINHLQQIFVVL